MSLEQIDKGNWRNQIATPLMAQVVPVLRIWAPTTNAVEMHPQRQRKYSRRNIASGIVGLTSISVLLDEANGNMDCAHFCIRPYGVIHTWIEMLAGMIGGINSDLLRRPMQTSDATFE